MEVSPQTWLIFPHACNLLAWRFRLGVSQLELPPICPLFLPTLLLPMLLLPLVQFSAVGAGCCALQSWLGFISTS
jgi:hypothetical protein